MKLLIWCVFLFCLSTNYLNRFSLQTLRVTILDVGQGDSILVQYPGGAVQLLDSGDTKNELFLDLASRNILKINAALLTHPDQDHGKGFVDLFANLNIHEFWIHKAHNESDKKLMADLRNLARDKIKTYSKPTSLLFHHAQLTLFPLSEKKLNDQSLIQLLEFAGCRFLFTGDIESPAEEKLSLLLRDPIHFLKVPHHGSHSSSTDSFLRKIKPLYAFISVGKQNHYGHPHNEILKRYEKIGAQILRTDFHGYIQIEVAPNGTYRCKNYLGNCGSGFCATKEAVAF